MIIQGHGGKCRSRDIIEAQAPLERQVDNPAWAPRVRRKIPKTIGDKEPRLANFDYKRSGNQACKNAFSASFALLSPT